MTENEVPSSKVKFWAILMIMMVGVAVAVTLIDLSIKAAILEESGNLRKVILGQREDGPGNLEGNTPDARNNGHSFARVLHSGDAGMEAGYGGRRSTQPPPSTEGIPGPIPVADPEVPQGDVGMGAREEA